MIHAIANTIGILSPNRVNVNPKPKEEISNSNSGTRIEMIDFERLADIVRFLENCIKIA